MPPWLPRAVEAARQAGSCCTWEMGREESSFSWPSPAQHQAFESPFSPSVHIPHVHEAGTISPVLLNKEIELSS